MAASLFQDRFKYKDLYFIKAKEFKFKWYLSDLSTTLL